MVVCCFGQRTALKGISACLVSFRPLCKPMWKSFRLNNSLLNKHFWITVIAHDPYPWDVLFWFVNFLKNIFNNLKRGGRERKNWKENIFRSRMTPHGFFGFFFFFRMIKHSILIYDWVHYLKWNSTISDAIQGINVTCEKRKPKFFDSGMSY